MRKLGFTGDPDFWGMKVDPTETVRIAVETDNRRNWYEEGDSWTDDDALYVPTKSVFMPEWEQTC